MNGITESVKLGCPGRGVRGGITHEQEQTGLLAVEKCLLNKNGYRSAITVRDNQWKPAVYVQTSLWR